MASSRHDARRRALEVLYQADLRERLDDLVAGAGLPAFAAELVNGVARRRGELDVLITTHAHDWKLSRMPVLDRNVLRIGAWELLHSDVPTAVVINEAVELAKELSTDDSGRFVNGVLARIAAGRPQPGRSA